jgi:glycosyltransferase involved in cell wall biosynthesis
MINDKKRIEHPILTIAIPTYNRPIEIQRQIRLLLPQLTEQVKLVVYDNSSEPSVKSYFTDEELEKVLLIRNKVNVGADANIARCFENCTTQWLWTLSDDDFVRKDVVVFLLELLNRNSETVFLNFCKGISFKTSGFNELAKEFKSSIVFSSSFTMSSCLYNMEKIQTSLQDYYNNLSSMMGTIIMVLKYVQRNDTAVCEFMDETLIESYNDQVGWDYRIYIRRTRLFVEAFYNKKNNSSYNKTLFLGCYLTNYWLITNNRNQKKVSYNERWGLFLLTMKNQGIVNSVIYCPKTIIRVSLNLILEHKYIKRLKGIK